ncbi:MAG: tyrosine-type recombinase/integrase [Rudaea sp.]|nr:tyrosine-type recombinase/integrase [Rudaea sp.]
MKLTDTLIRKTKPSDAPIRLSDGGGMYLLLNPNGSRWWRFDYRFSGARKTLSFGTYPDTSLKLAREHRDNARKSLASGIDPSAKRQAEKVAGADTFESIAREWFAKFAPGWAKGHSDKILRRLETNLFPWIGSKSIASIEAPELLACLQRIERRGALDTAHRAHQNSGQIFRYAIATGRAQRDPSGDLRGALPPARHSHYATITDPVRIGKLLRDIDGYRGGFAVGSALRLAPLVFTRPGELRKATWSEFDLDNAEWRIPAERMKARVEHVVPLSKQAVAILRELQPYTEATGLLFPGQDRRKPMSDNTANKALRSLGYRGSEFTSHGFRGMASTLLNEQGWPRDAIERQLAHGERDKVRAAYNHAQHMPERRKMMQAWANYLDRLRVGAKVIPIKRAAK